MAIIIDVTTQNKIYNPTSPQGQWYLHRWGQRNYHSAELSFDEAKNWTPGGKESILVRCAYGDAAEWPHLMQYSAEYQQRLCITTYGMFKATTAKRLADNNSIVHVLLDGIGPLCGKIHLGADWRIIQRNLRVLKGNACVEMYVYEHNKHQVEALAEFAKTTGFAVKFTSGLKNDNFGCCIIDQHGDWLYDAIAVDIDTEMLHEHNDLPVFSEGNELYKTIMGYNTLRTYVKQTAVRNIHQKPMIARQDLNHAEFKLQFESKDGIYITPTNYCFNNHDVYNMYMFLLGNDWELSKSTVINNTDYYLDKVFYFASRLYAQL